MSRRRFRATPAPATSGGFAIGVTMTPLAPPAAPQSCSSGANDPSGPLIFEVGARPNLPGYESESGCGWIAVMSGIGAGANVVWTVSWNEMDGPNASVVYHGAFSNSTIGIGTTDTASIYWIDVTCTVDGVAYSVRIGREFDDVESGVNLACAY